MSFWFVGERLAVDLLNTVIAQHGTMVDLLGTRGAVAAWAEAAGVVHRGGLTHGSPGLGREPEGLPAFREGLRRGLVAWGATGKPSRRLVALINCHLARDPEVEVISVSRGNVTRRRRPRGTPLDRLYGAVARSAAELLEGGDPGRLRKCADPSCQLMFYDVSRAGRRRWCSMQTCGARAKVRAFYRRRRGL